MLHLCGVVGSPRFLNLGLIRTSLSVILQFRGKATTSDLQTLPAGVIFGVLNLDLDYLISEEIQLD